MLETIPPKRRQKSRRLPRPQPYTPAVTGPVLTYATFDVGTGALVLAFDRDINIDDAHGATVLVDDSASGFIYAGVNGYSQPTANSIQFGMASQTPSTQAGVHLNASENTGIKSADDDQEWAGVANLPLPYFAS